MTTTARRLALIAVAAIMTTAGCSSPTGSTAAQHNLPAAVTLDDLLSAPVPELCKHEPGNLVNGKLPDQDPRYGHVSVAKRPAPSGDYWVALGDLTGDGVDDGGLVTACSAGGVPWPATVQLYSAGPTRLGGVDLSDLTHGGREVVTGLSIVDGVAHVAWVTQGPGEPECCGTVEMAGDLRWDGSRVVTENVKQTN
jgi:hypothetical protein